MLANNYGGANSITVRLEYVNSKGMLAKILKKISIILTSLLISIGVAKAETWNMALAYGAGNFHSQNATAFAEAVTKKSGGKLTIKTHPGGSLFKGGAILRAVQTGQTQIGERFMSAH